MTFNTKNLFSLLLLSSMFSLSASESGYNENGYSSEGTDAEMSDASTVIYQQPTNIHIDKHTIREIIDETFNKDGELVAKRTTVQQTWWDNKQGIYMKDTREKTEKFPSQEEDKDCCRVLWSIFGGGKIKKH